MATQPLKAEHMRKWLEGVPINSYHPNSKQAVFRQSQKILSSVHGWPDWLGNPFSPDYPSADLATKYAIVELANSVNHERRSPRAISYNWTAFELDCFKKVLPVFLSTIVTLKEKAQRVAPMPTSQTQWKTSVLAFITAVLDCSKDSILETTNHQIAYQLDQRICMPWSFNATPELTDLFASTMAEFTISTVTCSFRALSRQLPDDPGLTFLSWLAEPDTTAKALNVLQCAVEFASPDPRILDPSLRISAILALAQGQHRALRMPDDYIFGMTSESGTVTVYASTQTLRIPRRVGAQPVTIAPVETLDLKKPRDLLRFFCVLLSIRRHLLSIVSRMSLMQYVKFLDIIDDLKGGRTWKVATKVSTDAPPPLTHESLARLESEVLEYLAETAGFVDDSLSSDTAVANEGISNKKLEPGLYDLATLERMEAEVLKFLNEPTSPVEASLSSDTAAVAKELEETPDKELNTGEWIRDDSDDDLYE